MTIRTQQSVAAEVTMCLWPTNGSGRNTAATNVLVAQFGQKTLYFELEENPAVARGIVKVDEKALKSHILQVQHLSISST